MRSIEATGFEVVPEDYEYDPKEIIETKPMGNITKVVFADGKIEYCIFDSQVGVSVIKVVEGEKREKIFDQNKPLLAQVAFNTLP